MRKLSVILCIPYSVLIAGGRPYVLPSNILTCTKYKNRKSREEVKYIRT